jgi:NADH dehydrogenase
VNIFVAGASSFLGERVLEELIRSGHTVTAHVHRNTSQQMLAKKYPGISLVQCDLSSSEQVRGIIKSDMDAVMWFPGLLRDPDGKSFERVHIEATRNLISEFKQTTSAGKRWIHCSALGTGPLRAEKYFTTKWRAEELVRSSGFEYTILKPSLIFDDRPRWQHNFVTGIARTIRLSPFIPSVGTGNYLMQPVSVDDIVQTIMQSLAKPETIGKTYELGGPDKLTFDELSLIIARAMGAKKLLIHFPFWLIMPVVRILERIPSFLVSTEVVKVSTSGWDVRDPAREKEWQESFDLPMKRFTVESVRKFLGE